MTHNESKHNSRSKCSKESLPCLLGRELDKTGTAKEEPCMRSGGHYIEPYTRGSGHYIEPCTK